MAKLELFLLGPPRLVRDGAPLRFDTRKIMALVAYLAVSGLESRDARFSRESLLALLWPDLEPTRARAVLRRNLSLLRSALEGEWLVVEGQMIGTDPDAGFWLDVDQFTRLVRVWETHDHPPEQSCPECLEAQAEAVALYQGDFLQGFSLRDSVAYDEWQFFQAEGLRQQLALALERLVMGYSARGDWESALDYARRWLALDQLHEPAHRQLMLLYAQTGQRSAALRQYRECVRILDEELGLAPSEETTSLYEQIRTAPAASAAGALGLDEGVELPVRAAVPHHNLPAQTTPFIGRKEELAEIGARLQDPACRLLTLLGPGGIGKTRLAIQSAEVLLEARPTPFEHGVFFVPLASLPAAEGVVPAVAEALGFSFRATEEGSERATPRQQLLDYLQSKQLLLVMDNYEHLLVDGASWSDGDGRDSTRFVTDLLSTAPGVKVVVTSRVGLKVQGEHLYPLKGLPVPDPVLPIPAGDWQSLRGYCAVELFIQGGQRVRPDLELGSQELGHIADICRLVQGMPLGILLAAAWVEMLTPEEIAAEIQQSLDFLETDLRDVPLRQRSIRAVFDHSWRLLDEREREVFQALSVFRGSFTREAAREVVGASLRDLMSLINKSLLHPSLPGRYQLHELLRQYGAERLGFVADRGNAVRDRHCAHYSSALERWAADLKGARQREALDEMDLEIENGRAAWHWAVERRLVARLAQGAEGIWLYYSWRLRHQEGEAAFEAAVGALDGTKSLEAQRLRAMCLILWSNFHLEQGRKHKTLRTARRGMALLRDLEAAGHDVRREMALAQFHEARINRYFRPDPLEAQENYRQSAALYEALGDRWGLARALGYLGWTAEQLGHFGEAQELCEKSLAIRQELGDQRGMADAMMNLGIIAWVQGRLNEAQRLLQKSLGVFRILDDWVRVAQTVKSLGEVLVRRGQFEEGLAVVESSIDIYDDLGFRYGVRGLLPFLAEAKLHIGRYGEARADARQGASYSDRYKHLWGVGFANFVQGLAVLAQGAHGEAQALFQGAVAAFDGVRQRENRGWALGPLGLAAREAGDMPLARQCVAEALQIGVDLEVFMPAMYGLPVAALLLADQGALERAVEVYACASRYEFVSKSRWFEDMIGRQIRTVAASLPLEAIEAAQDRGRAQDWYAMAAELLTEISD
jgi:predicted ATPase/DNA-binding SARP family transcriptional activator